MTKANYSDAIIRSMISALISAVIVAGVTRYTLISTLSDEMIKIELRVKNLEERYVEFNEFEPTKIQAIENKNRINENMRQLQRHEVQISGLLP